MEIKHSFRQKEMEEKNKVILHGMWVSTYSKRVELALKIKGIPYEYVEEALSNKSQLLLKYNPIHKKVPVLVHNKKPIAESIIILEYVDETWKTVPRLLPDDPFERAKVRFWASFIQKQLFDALSCVVMSDGEAQEKAVKELSENLNLLEEGMKDFFPKNCSSITRDLDLLDILMSATFSPYEAQEEVLGFKILDPERNPIIHSWVTSLNKHPLVKEILPPHDRLVEVLQFMRTNLKPSS